MSGGESERITALHSRERFLGRTVTHTQGAKVVTYAEAAGWRGHDQLVKAAAVAKAESGWDEEARNPSGAAGLWQILPSAHPEKFKMGDWRDGRVNARMAYAVWLEAGKSWRPWDASKANHDKNMPAAEQAYQEYSKLTQDERVSILSRSGSYNPVNKVDDAVTGVVGIAKGGVESVFSAIGQIVNAVTLWVIAIVLFVLAVVLIIVGKPTVRKVLK